MWGEEGFYCSVQTYEEVISRKKGKLLGNISDEKEFQEEARKRDEEEETMKEVATTTTTCYESTKGEET
jgi:hypothetical protein